MFQTLSNWRCKCDVRITVIGETLKEQPSASQIVACPKCGDKQMVYADKVISIETEMNESGYGRR